MLKTIGFSSMDSFIEAVIPRNILEKDKVNIGQQRDEESVLKDLKEIASQNKVFKSYIGQGHFNTITPKVILRNIF